MEIRPIMKNNLHPGISVHNNKKGIIMRASSILPFILFSTVQAADPVTPAWTGFRGPEGTGVWANAKPPTIWDGATGQNIRWKAPLANWGLGQPVVVKGKVFVMSEPGWKHDWPLLQCFDVATGKLAWEKELNTIDLLPDLPGAEKEELKKAIAGVFTFDREWYLARWEYSQGTPEGIAKGVKHLKGIGYMLPDAQPPATFAAAIKITRDPALEELKKKQVQKLNQIGWTHEAWRHAGYASGLMSIGHAYPTPVTDGERIYIATGCSSFWCFDLEGKMVWGVATKEPRHTECMNAKSPLLYKNLFISDIGYALRFFDKNTGKILFSAPVKVHSISGPVVIRVGDQDLLLPCPPEGADGFAYRLPDGQQIPIKGWKDGGATMMVNTDSRNTVFFRGGGEHGNWQGKGGAQGKCDIFPPAAVKFSLVDGALNGTVLWSGLNGGMGHAGILYYHQRFYYSGGKNGGCVDAATGKVIRTGVTPTTSSDLQIANGYIYGNARNDPNGLMQVFDLDGNKVAENIIPSALVEGEKREQIRAQNSPHYGHDQQKADKSIVFWRWFSQSCPFMIHDNTIFIRSNDELWCIASEAIASPLDDDAQIASITAAKDLPTLTPQFTASRPRYRREALLRLAALKPPLTESVSKSITAMITEDPYPEVRAAAIQALDVCDPAGTAGWQVYVAHCLSTYKLWNPWHAKDQRPFNLALKTARALDAKAMTTHIQRDVATATAATMFVYLSVAKEAGLVLPSLVDRALDLMQKLPKDRHGGLVTSAALYLLDTVKADPRSLPAVWHAKTLPAERIILLLEWRLPVEDFPAFLEEQLRPGTDLGTHDNIVGGTAANMFRRIDKARAIPLLEKIAIARPDIKDKLSAITKSLQ